MADQLDCALDLMRRMPPENIENNLAGLLDIVPHLTESLLSAVDQPLKIAHDKETGRDYLLCDYNRDGDSYRSPWSNKYDPPLDDGGATPSAKLRQLEVHANEVFDVYRDMYFEGGISSVYCWDLDDGFACVVLIKKIGDTAKKSPVKGAWDSIHVVEVIDRAKAAHYKLTSTIMLSLTTQANNAGSVSLAGSLTRQAEQDYPVNDSNPHVANIGRMIEDMELKLRTSLDQIYFGKTKDIVGELRANNSLRDTKKMNVLQSGLVKDLKARQTKP
jgi:capping protein beta